MQRDDVAASVSAGQTRQGQRSKGHRRQVVVSDESDSEAEDVQPQKRQKRGGGRQLWRPRQVQAAGGRMPEAPLQLLLVGHQLQLPLWQAEAAQLADNAPPSKQEAC